MKIFSNQNNYNKEHRYYLNDITKSLWSERAQEAEKLNYTGWLKNYKFESNKAEADIHLLNYSWNYYLTHNKISEAWKEVEAARAHRKPIVIFNGGDYPANLPFKDVILFEQSGYRSTPGLRYHSAQPGYIWDYLESYNGGKLELRHKKEVPIIGFCGQASTSFIQTVYRKLRLQWQQKQYQNGKLKWEPPPFETTSFRTRALKQFENIPGFQTHYLLRRRYHGGDVNAKSLKKATKQTFVNNILESDYTVCMRGGGNFSLRFYETLCLGRIPIFIDTDCLLPFQDEIDYKSTFPWIDVEDISHAAEIVRDFHSRLSDQDFLNLQRACRELWLDHMTPNGFYRDLAKKLNKIIRDDP